MRRFVVSCVLAVTSLACADTPPAPAALGRSANELLAAGNVDEAIATLESAREADPGSAELAYNLGVAKYRAGKFSEAADLFKEAAAKANANLAAKAMFNQGTSVYADALSKLPDPSAMKSPSIPTPEGDAAPDPLQEAITAVEKSLTHFRDAAQADRNDTDSRANAERAWRLLKQLREEQKKQEEQKNEQNQQQQQQNQQNKDQQNKDQQNQDQQNQKGDQNRSGQQGDNQNQQEKKDGQKNDSSKGGQDQREPQDRDNEQRNSSKGSDDQKQGDQGKQRESDKKGERKDGDLKENPSNGSQQQQQQPKDGQEKDSNAKDGSQAGSRTNMSREEAERLLQIVRDKEKERREQKARAERARQQPVQKDW
ncbi:MAG: tetratricopeptide repeat protein [Phycisphaerae bacterium]|nr:tetratricopeptide repeat protein [Phycisphaerae bacterium]